MIPWVVGGLILALGGYHQYEKIKVGDRLRVNTSVGGQADIIVRSVADDCVYGTVVLEGGGNAVDTQVPVKVLRSQIVKNLTPRFW